MAKHIKPLYITVHTFGQVIPQCLVDNRATMNIIPASVMKRMGRTYEDLLPTDVVVANFMGESSKPK